MTTHPIFDDGTAELRSDMAQKAALLSDDGLRDEPEGLWFEILQVERTKRCLPEGFGKV
jgi:hypothetical protein